MLGKRPKDIYGIETYEDLKNQINHFAQNNSIDVEFFQSNSEGQIIDRIQKLDFEIHLLD